MLHANILQVIECAYYVNSNEIILYYKNWEGLEINHVLVKYIEHLNFYGGWTCLLGTYTRKKMAASSCIQRDNIYFS